MINRVEINLSYNGMLYRAEGTEYLWEDAFANLQKNLPHNVKLACCMTCQHGNMCPCGNEENQLFCTKDASIASKDDMIKLIYEDASFFGRKVASINYCKDFMYQSDDFYTYNDYLYYLKKAKS